MTPIDRLAAWIATILKPIVIEAVKAAFAEMKDTAEISKPNADLQNSWNDSRASD